MSPPASAAPARRDSFESLLEPVLPAAYRLAAHLAGQRADAEDLLQEAALLALRGFASFQPGTNFKAWFFRVLTNRFFARCRTAKRRPVTVELEDAPALYLYARTGELGLHERSSDPAALFLERMTQGQVVAALGGLPAEYRAVATLFFVEDLSYDEIGDVLGVPPGTVRSRLHRGRKLLQRELWQLAVDAGIVRDLAPASAAVPPTVASPEGAPA